MPKPAVMAEIVAMLILVVVIQWLAATVLQTKGFWPSLIGSAIYLCGRMAYRAIKPREPSS